MHPQFLMSLEQLQRANVHANEASIERLFKSMMFYQVNKTNPDFPLWLLTRELGGRYLDWDTKEYAIFSNDVFTIVLDEYFHSYPEGLSYIFNNLKRISKNNIDIEVLTETTYDEEESPEVTIQFRAGTATYTVSSGDDYGRGILGFNFVKEELIPKIKGTITKGHLFWMSDQESFTFIYSEDPKKFSDLPYELVNKGFLYSWR